MTFFRNITYLTLSNYLWIQTYEEQEKLIQELTKKNEELQAEKELELKLKDESLARAEAQLNQIKEKMDKFADDDFTNELSILRQELIEKVSSLFFLIYYKSRCYINLRHCYRKTR